MEGIEGRVAFVTGAGGGIGSAVVRTLAGYGATVAAVDLEMDRLASVAGAGDPAMCPYKMDVRDTASVEAAVSTVEADLGAIAILVNVAGILRTGPLIDVSDEDWRDVIDVNTTGALRVSRAVARRMVRRRRGAIVTVGSNAAGVPRIGMGAYAVSKAAAAHLMRCFGLELAEYGIRCNLVAPGSTDTDMLRSMWTHGDGADSVIRGSLERFRVGIPLGRLAQPRDVAEAVAFLASDRARHITMQELTVDGGAALGG